jgi:uncharacterized membrane protein YraQ (UPF0718 family)
MNHLIHIVQFVGESFLTVWPYLLITIPLAVAVNLSGASRHIGRALMAQPILAIVLATLVGAFSPFCSCGVIPVIASLLIGGVPLAPVMAFWIASPSMDPEIFFLSVGTLGWELALWRLLGTLTLSIGAGLITHIAIQRGWLGTTILRSAHSTRVRNTRVLLSDGWRWLRRQPDAFSWSLPAPTPALALSIPVTAKEITVSNIPGSTCGDGDDESSAGTCSLTPSKSMRRRLLEETWAVTAMVVKFMALAFFLEALIIFYVPSEWITSALGQENQWSILSATLLGVPVYTSNLSALALIGGLLAQGMNPAAALAFLIAGPTTTLPAMAAVHGLVTRRIFALYILFILVGAIVLGYLYQIVLWSV